MRVILLHVGMLYIHCSSLKRKELHKDLFCWCTDSKQRIVSGSLNPAGAKQGILYLCGCSRLLMQMFKYVLFMQTFVAVQVYFSRCTARG